MNRNSRRLAVLVACIACFSTVVPKAPEQTAQRQTIELLKAKGNYVSLQGQSLFLTSSVKTKQAGYWLNIGTNPATPVLVNDKLPAAWDVAVVGKHAFVCAYTKFLIVYEIKEQQWQLAAKLAMPSMTENITIRGHLAYVANHNAGLTIVDISTPAKPVLISNFNPGIDCDAIGLWKDCAVLYGHQKSRLVLVDISDPAKPRRLGVYQHDAKTFNQGEIQVDKGLAYCTATNGLVIVNVADPANPKLVKVVDMKRVNDVKVLGGYAFVSSRNGVTVLDVRDPPNPAQVGNYKCNVHELSVEFVSKDYYIYAAGGDGLKVLRFRPSLER